MLNDLVLALGCARLLTLKLEKACYTLVRLHCLYVHIHLDVPVNKHFESALAEDVIDDEVAGPRSLLTAPSGVLPPPSSRPMKCHFSVVGTIRCGVRQVRGGRVTEDTGAGGCVLCFIPLLKQLNSV